MEIPNLFNEWLLSLSQLKDKYGLRLLYSAVTHAPEYIPELVYLYREDDFLTALYNEDEGSPYRISAMEHAVRLDRVEAVLSLIIHYNIAAWRLSFLLTEVRSTKMMDAMFNARDARPTHKWVSIVCYLAKAGRANVACCYLTYLEGAKMNFKEMDEWPFDEYLMSRALTHMDRPQIHALVEKILSLIRDDPAYDRRLLICILKHINRTGGYKDTMPQTLEAVVQLPQPDKVLSEVFDYHFGKLHNEWISLICQACCQKNLPFALRHASLFDHGKKDVFATLFDHNSRMAPFLLAMPILYTDKKIRESISDKYLDGYFRFCRIGEAIKLYLNHPQKARQQAEQQLFGVDRSANALALTVYLCDDYLASPASPAPTGAPAAKSEETERSGKAVRFFNITKQLPFDMQHVVCSFVGDYPKDQISHTDLEQAFLANASHYGNVSHKGNK